jgi:HSP20 family protein
MSEAITTPQKNDTMRENALPVVRPHYNVRQSEDAFELGVVLPGVRREDISLRLEDSVLQIDARREIPQPEGWKPLRRELADAQYRLALRISIPVDAEHISAKLENGILSLRLPIREEAQPRTIAIQ